MRDLPDVALLPVHHGAATVEVDGYTIPEDAQILVKVWGISRDSATLENKDELIPERSLGSDIDVKGQNFKLLPFGRGRRMCPGLPLALRM